MGPVNFSGVPNAAALDLSDRAPTMGDRGGVGWGKAGQK